MQKHPIATAMSVAAFTMLATTACSHIPVTTLYRLATFDPVTADPAALRAAVRYPTALAVRRDGATLTLTLKSGAKPSEHKFVLVRSELPTDVKPLAARARAGFEIEVYRFSDADAARVRGLQAAHKGAGGNIGIAVEACRRGALPTGPILSSTFLRLDAAARDYMTVVEDIDLRREFGEGLLQEKIPPCGAP